MQRDHRGKANLVDLAKQWLKARYDKPGRVFVGLVHRLDAPVAGVLVLARTSKAAARLSEQFRQGVVRKTYLGVVSPRPAKPADRLTHCLVRRGRFSRIAPENSTGSQRASLSYRELAHHQGKTLLEIDLETGRRHQIRAQLAAIGSPILGDRSYGAAQALDHGRIALLAAKLSFNHPTRKISMDFKTPLPEGWPGPSDEAQDDTPLWAIEEYVQAGLVLPVYTDIKGA